MVVIPALKGEAIENYLNEQSPYPSKNNYYGYNA